MINQVTLMGRLTSEPELKNTNNNMQYCRFTLAVDRATRSGEEKKADFISCIAWNKTAEFICRYFYKGLLIAAEGELRTGNYTDRDGNKHYTTDVLVDKVHFAERAMKKSTDSNENNDYIPHSENLPF